MGLLSDVRVLELSTPPTMLAGRMLADLGAHVVAVEPPGGAKGRRLEPFADGLPGLERSLTWRALNYNKRGATLDCRSIDGRALLEQLAARFDVVLEAHESFAPSLLEGWAPPANVTHVRVRPFAPNGPKAHYRTTDMILMAAGGAPALAGDNDREPLFFPVPQAMFEAGAEAAVAAMAALVARDRDGQGQSVEVSGHIAAMAGAMGRIVSGFSGDAVAKRTPPAAGSDSPLAMSNFLCADGEVVLHLAFGGAFAAMTRNMIAWVVQEGELPAHVADTDWSQYAARNASGAPMEPVRELTAALARVCAKYTKFEIVEASRARGFMTAPVMTMADVSRFPHYRERGLFVEGRASNGGEVIDVPARFAQLEDSIEIRMPAPKLSEHTAALLQDELGLSQDEVQALYVHEVI